MEEKKLNDAVQLNKEEVEEVSGGYCPQTPDRTCKVEAVGRWDPDNEECRYCICSFTGEKSLCGSVLNAAAVSAGKVNPITAVRSRPSISTSKSRMNRSGHR